MFCMKAIELAKAIKAARLPGLRALALARASDPEAPRGDRALYLGALDAIIRDRRAAFWIDGHDASDARIVEAAVAGLRPRVGHDGLGPGASRAPGHPLERHRATRVSRPDPDGRSGTPDTKAPIVGFSNPASPAGVCGDVSMEAAGRRPAKGHGPRARPGDAAVLQ